MWLVWKTFAHSANQPFMAVDVDRDNNMNISVERRRSSRDNGGEREEFDLGTLMTHYETVREQLWPLYWLLVEIKRSRR